MNKIKLKGFGENPIKTIDITPSWSSLANMLCAIIENGTDEGKAYACVEVRRMGQYIDKLRADSKAAMSDTHNEGNANAIS